MAAVRRIYAVRPKGCEDKSKYRLVRSAHPAHAQRHVTDDLFEAYVAPQDLLVELTLAGVQVEEIGQEQAELPTD